MVQIMIEDVTGNPSSLLEVDVRHENTDELPELPLNFLRHVFRVAFTVHGLLLGTVTGVQVCSSDRRASDRLIW